MTSMTLWAAAGVLGMGALFTVGIDTQRVLPLQAPLDASVPGQMAGHVGRDIEISKSEQAVAGMTNYLMRHYRRPDRADGGDYDYSVYVGYYASQRQGRTIHSPKNCLPGAGWEALASTTATVETADGPATVNRYLLKRKDQAALVLYWYQGRGRIESNEYRVKWDLLRDAALNGRSDEALVRIIVPLTSTEEEAAAIAMAVARNVVPAVAQALPGGV